MLVSFWSTVRERAGVTTNLACISTFYTLRYKIKTLIFENHYNLKNLEVAFSGNTREQNLVREEPCYYQYHGIDPLLKRLRADYGEDVRGELVMPLLSGNLQYLPLDHSQNKQVFEYELNQVMEKLLYTLQENGEIVFVDTARWDNLSTRTILDKSDLVVVNLTQEASVLSDFFKQYSSLCQKMFLVLGCYRENSEYNLKNISRIYDFPLSRMGAVPYNRELPQAFYEGKIIHYIQRNYYSFQRDRAFYFIKQLKYLSEKLHESLNEIGG